MGGSQGKLCLPLPGSIAPGEARMVSGQLEAPGGSEAERNLAGDAIWGPVTMACRLPSFPCSVHFVCATSPQLPFLLGTVWIPPYCLGRDPQVSQQD